MLPCKKKLFIFLLVQVWLGVSSSWAAIPGVIENLNVVTPEIYRGARPRDAGLDELAKMGIKTLIDLQGGDVHIPLIGGIAGAIEPGELSAAIAEEGRAAEARGMNFYNFPLNSMKKISDFEAGEIQALLQIMNDPKYQPVYVHCERGVDRTGLVVALYRYYYQAWTPEAAHAEMVKMGHHGLFDTLLTGAMDRYFSKVTGWHKNIVPAASESVEDDE